MIYAIFDHVKRSATLPKTIYLETRETRYAAVRLYTRAGFEVERDFVIPTINVPFVGWMHDHHLLFFTKDVAS